MYAFLHENWHPDNPQVLLWNLSDYESGGLLKPKDAWVAPAGGAQPQLAARMTFKVSWLSPMGRAWELQNSFQTISPRRALTV